MSKLKDGLMDVAFVVGAWTILIGLGWGMLTFATHIEARDIQRARKEVVKVIEATPYQRYDNSFLNEKNYLECLFLVEIDDKITKVSTKSEVIVKDMTVEVIHRYNKWGLHRIISLPDGRKL